MQANHRSGDSGRFRMLEKPTEETPSGCFVWTGTKNSGNYGLITFNGSQVLAHRFVYMMMHPSENISSKVIMHTCDNPSCVNPEHLISGTQSENMLDCSSKGRYGSHRTSKLTEDQVREIKYSLLPPRFYCQKYSVGKSTISAIRTGTTWSHI